MAATRPAPASFGRLIRIADRLRELPAGTAAADADTSHEAALRTLLAWPARRTKTSPPPPVSP